MTGRHCMFVLAVGVAGLCASMVLAETAVAVDPLDARFERLVETAREGMTEHGIPGAALGVLVEGRTFTRGIGVTHVEHSLAVTDETLFQIGSITKTFTGTLLVRLAEDNRIDLDAPIRRYLPEFRVADARASAEATARDLLTHMGGWIGDEFIDLGEGDDALARAVSSLNSLEQLAPFRTVWSYNNSGFYVAGRLVEVLTGKTYEAALQERLLRPLGLDHCFIFPVDVMTHRYAVGHARVENRLQVLRPWAIPRVTRPVGGLTCSVRDVLRYSRFHMGDGTAEDGTKIISADGLAAMRTPVLTKHGAEEMMGLTWHLVEHDGVLEVGHGGATLGQIALLMLVPERDFALVMLANSSGGRALGRTLRRWALREYLGIEVTDPQPLDVASEELEEYTGLYSRPFADVELKLENGRLMAFTRLKQGFPTKDSPIPPHDTGFVLQMYEKDRFLHASGPSQGRRAQIIRNADGSIGWLRVSGRIHPRVSQGRASPSN